MEMTGDETRTDSVVKTTDPLSPVIPIRHQLYLLKNWPCPLVCTSRFDAPPGSAPSFTTPFHLEISLMRSIALFSGVAAAILLSSAAVAQSTGGCPAGQTEVRPGACQAPQVPPP